MITLCAEYPLIQNICYRDHANPVQCKHGLSGNWANCDSCMARSKHVLSRVCRFLCGDGQYYVKYNDRDEGCNPIDWMRTFLC